MHVWNTISALAEDLEQQNRNDVKHAEKFKSLGSRLDASASGFIALRLTGKERQSLERNA